MLTAREIAAMRCTEECAMSSTAVIRRNSLTPDGMGGYNDSWSIAGTTICDVWAINTNRSDRENTTAGGQIITHAQWFITVPYNTDVTAKDRLEIDNRTFELTFVPSSHSWNTALRCEAITHNTESRL